MFWGTIAEQDQKKKKSLSSCSLYSGWGECAFLKGSERPMLKKWGIRNISVTLSNSQVHLILYTSVTSKT